MCAYSEENDPRRNRQERQTHTPSCHEQFIKCRRGCIMVSRQRPGRPHGRLPGHLRFATTGALLWLCLLLPDVRPRQWACPKRLSMPRSVALGGGRQMNHDHQFSRLALSIVQPFGRFQVARNDLRDRYTKYRLMSSICAPRPSRPLAFECRSVLPEKPIDDCDLRTYCVPIAAGPAEEIPRPHHHEHQTTRHHLATDKNNHLRLHCEHVSLQQPPVFSIAAITSSFDKLFPLLNRVHPRFSTRPRAVSILDFHTLSLQGLRRPTGVCRRWSCLHRGRPRRFDRFARKDDLGMWTNHDDKCLTRKVHGGQNRP